MAFIIKIGREAMHSLKKVLREFLVAHFNGEAPLLVAFSGGSDSMVLTALLIELKDELKIEIELAHVDHCYRKESSKEAYRLQEWAKEKEIPFHLMKIEELPTKNVEDFFRIKRYSFFEALFKKRNYEALLLAHHRDDLEETVLKRLLEGAFISELSALRVVSCREEMPIWRPLLEVSKEEILKYAEKNYLDPIYDPTNFDGSNLRSKMRTKIIPMLEKELGKNIRSSLFNLAKYSELISNYLKENIESKRGRRINQEESIIDFSHLRLHPLEIHFFLKKKLKEHNILLNRKEIQTAMKLIQNKSVGKSIIKKNIKICFDHQKLLIKAIP